MNYELETARHQMNRTGQGSLYSLFELTLARTITAAGSGGAGNHCHYNKRNTKVFTKQKRPTPYSTNTSAVAGRQSIPTRDTADHN